MTGTAAPPRGGVVISGCSSGMGEDAARYLNELGYTVFAGVRHEEEGDAVRARAARPEAFHPVAFDVTSSDQIAQARARIEEMLAGRPLVGLFSNAGIAAFDGDSSCEGVPFDTLERVMNVDFLGGARFVREFLPLLRTSRGTIVFNSALMTRVVFPFNAGYASAKAALEAWAVSLRREVHPFGIRVVVIRPAAITTELGSRQHVDRIPEGGLYPAQAPMIRTFVDMQTRGGATHATSPRRVSEIVAESIAARRPPLTRIVGGGSRGIRLFGSLPQRVQDWVLAKVTDHFAAGEPSSSARR